MLTLSKRGLLVLAMLLLAVSLGSGVVGAKIGTQYERNRECCQTPRVRNVWLSAREMLGLVKFPSQIGQDKWVLETVFPNVRNGFFLDVGSADGTLLSNTKALEQRGWTGVCIDPFPTNMQGRTCQVLKEVVFSEPGKSVQFQAYGELGGVVDTLGVWKDRAMKAPTVEFKTTTLSDILARTNAPALIHFMSLDIEGAELEALKGFPFDKYKIGALAVEHNFEEPKRTEIAALLKSHGYVLSHTWRQDDFYVPANRQ
jgi:FkbM family methyltransferase